MPGDASTSPPRSATARRQRSVSPRSRARRAPSPAASPMSIRAWPRSARALMLPRDADESHALRSCRLRASRAPPTTTGCASRWACPTAAAISPSRRRILLEAGFDELHGIDWQKGCYIGQELTARTKYRALIKKRLMPVEVDGPLPPPGTAVMLGAEAGEMRSRPRRRRAGAAAARSGRRGRARPAPPLTAGGAQADADQSRVAASSRAHAVVSACSFGERGLRGGEARDRHAVGRAGDVIEPDLLAEAHRGGIAAMLAADAELQLARASRGRARRRSSSARRRRRGRW